MTADFRRPAHLAQVVAEEIPNPPSRSLETQEAYESATELAQRLEQAAPGVSRERLARLLHTDGPDAVVAEILATQPAGQE